ncbi:hypothetical protein V2H45_10365 [Tumidithrix elongata RA019]|uniref:Uncharacterized protein n=1 Tax=Tumidithrix elongata BACA0141 TaxID=2716417 RepID=A0AAW9PZW4_9CYAN|nr:hypothetical protein [Tumidithrix elongata RA019]
MAIDNKDKHLQWLRIFLLASIISTAIHYTDNYVFIADYPQPDWITLPSIYISWIVLTGIGILGYWLYQQDKFWLAYSCLSIYSLTGLSSVAHYFYGSISQFSLKMHFFIWTDWLTGFSILGFTLWSTFLAKSWLRKSNAEPNEQS